MNGVYAPEREEHNGFTGNIAACKNHHAINDMLH